MQDEPSINPVPQPSDPQPAPPNGAAPDQPAANEVSAQPITLLEPADMASYLRLRQGVDGFQTAALAFYATGKTVQERAERAENVQHFADEFKGAVMDDGCPAGQRSDGHGNCIPNDATSFRHP